MLYTSIYIQRNRRFCKIGYLPL